MRFSKTTFNISLTGMMLALVILFQYLERFMPLGATFMKINISLAFIVPSFFISGYWYGMLLLVLRLVIGPSFGTFGYDIIGLWSHLILFISGFIFLNLIYLGKKWRPSKVKNPMEKGIIIVILLSSIIMTVLNGFVFTPVYFGLFTNGESYNFVYWANNWSQWKFFFFGINSYWGGIFAVYILGNVINFAITGFLIFIILKHIKKNIVLY